MMINFLLLLITTNLFLMSKSNIFESFSDPLLFLSQIFSLIGTILLCYSFVLGSRSRFLENIFGGLDKVIKLHHIVGGISFVLLINHPILLAIKALPNLNLASKYLFLSTIFEYNTGIIALYGMIILLFLTIIIKLPYNIWLKTHDTFGIILFFACLHIFFISSDVSRYLPLRIWVFCNLAIGAFFYIYKVFLYKWFGPKYNYTVLKINETANILEIYLKPENESIKFKPGQFAFINFNHKGLKESHPFSFSSSPDEKIVRFSVKIFGDYTAKLRLLLPGTKCTIYGAYGRFYYNFFDKKDVVCIAGGIGITPFASLISYEEKHILPRKISLIYCAKNQNLAIYHDEFKEIQNRLSNFKYFPNFDDQMPKLNVQTIVQNIGDIKDKIFFICGPSTMMHEISAQLQINGVNLKNIIIEDFNFK